MAPKRRFMVLYDDESEDEASKSQKVEEHTTEKHEENEQGKVVGMEQEDVSEEEEEVQQAEVVMDDEAEDVYSEEHFDSSDDTDDLPPPLPKKAKMDVDQSNIKGKKKIEVSKPKMPKSEKATKKWTTLQHDGPIFPPEYKPHGVPIVYKGNQVDLTPEQEELVTLFVRVPDSYTKTSTFRKNFWADWSLILGQDHTVQDLENCDFNLVKEWWSQECEKRKTLTPEGKNEVEKHMWAVVDGIKQRVGNCTVEPPCLFKGRPEHPKNGTLKKRIVPEDVTINIGKDAPIPHCSMEGHTWKAVEHNDTATWLAKWLNPIDNKIKYVNLASNRSTKVKNDMERYDLARSLKDHIEGIRTSYRQDFTTSDMAKKQMAVAIYLIDKLAFRVGNEKDEDDVDAVGCCSLKVEQVTLVKPHTIELNSNGTGKDSIKYTVDPLVVDAMESFKKGKKKGKHLFDKLDTSKLNGHLKLLMPGLNPKIFRTYNASIILSSHLGSGSTNEDKLEFYREVTKTIASHCNHRQALPKSLVAQKQKLESKLEELKSCRVDIDREIETFHNDEKKLKPLERKRAAIVKKIENMEVNIKSKMDSFGTSKANYMDPRITVSWCKRNEVPIANVFNKFQLSKFSWAMDVDQDFQF